MATCKHWKDQPDGFHGYCKHPEAQPGDACILNTEDSCLLREHVCSECGRRVDVSGVPEADYYICEVCASYVTVKPGAGVVPRGGEELESIATCAVCAHDQPSKEYEEKGCVFCGADSEET
jgi:DNA-directed RNA polymerase subunit RPC12/RpoP